MNSSISPMTLADLPEVLTLCEELGYPATLNQLTLRFQKLQTLSSHALFVYKISDMVVGWIHLEAVDDLIEERKVEIKAIVVNQDNRGKKIGHHLIEQAKQWTKNLNLKGIYLSCNIKRLQTHQFYLKEGFSQNKTSHFFEIQV
jgi:N-acetylglutamate synthase-like GNAT family acetyltransferase